MISIAFNHNDATLNILKWKVVSQLLTEKNVPAKQLHSKELNNDLVHFNDEQATLSLV